MKKIITIILMYGFTLNSCSLDTNKPSEDKVKILCDLVNTSGGIAGVDDDFDSGTVTWTFDESNFTLTIENNNTDDSKQAGLNSGVYNYYVLSSGGESFLVVNSNEMGKIIVTSNQLVLDENERSGGTGADGFIYTFTKTILTE